MNRIHDVSAFTVERAADARGPLVAALLPRSTELDASLASLASLDASLGGAIGRALTQRAFRGSRDETFWITGAGDVQRVLLVGIGAAPSAAAFKRGASLAAREATKSGAGSISLVAPAMDRAATEAAVIGLHAGAWRWTDTKTPPKEEDERTPLATASIVAPDANDARDAIAAGNAIGAGHTLARTLGMTPGNICTPDFLANAARDVGARHGMQVTVWGRADLEREGMGSFLAVAHGTPQEPRLVTIEHRGGAEGSAPVVLVGKGLCFDSGGISIKPAAGMEWMKFDMSGAGGVIGAMEAIGGLKLSLNVVGIFGATTNMPSGTAMNPGDVVRSAHGTYIEIINTDAEGRLVLADLLHYAARFKPAAVLDAATLTGACVIALGHTATGVLGTDQALVDEVLAAGERVGERGWQLPLWDDYGDLIASEVADIKNSGGRPAGTITAAMFLKTFASEYPWVHLDIAGTAYSESDLGYLPAGPTGTPVGTFVELVRARARR